jgi:S1-C subfamily serine protease
MRHLKNSLLAGRMVVLLATSILPVSLVRAQDGDYSRQYKRIAPSVVTIAASDGSGTGFYVGGGKFVTNAHVVESDQFVDVIMSDGSRVAGFVMGSDPKEDIAIVGVDYLDVMALVALPFSKTLPEIGTRAYVIGSPGLEPGVVAPGTLTSGVVSNVSKDLVQVDAAINPGNSGGPVLNSRGEVIGMAEFIYKGKPGLNFAITTQRIDAALWRFSISKLRAH